MTQAQQEKEVLVTQAQREILEPLAIQAQQGISVLLVTQGLLAMWEPLETQALQEKEPLVTQDLQEM